MLSIKAAEYFVPEERIDPIEQHEMFGITKAQGKVYSKIYGIEQIPYAGNMSMQDLLLKPIFQLQEKINFSDANIKYLIHAYTSSSVSPFGISMVRNIAKSINIPAECAFATSINKCVSVFTAMEMASALLSDLSDNEHILVFTGEIGFTPELRVIPNTSITGDAAACLLLGKPNNKLKQLKTVSNIHGEFARGIWMTSGETAVFENQFIPLFCQTIQSLLKEANCKLEDIKIIIPHNINIPTWQKVSKHLNFPLKNIYLNNVKKYAHCFNADFIINLASIEQEQLLKPGDLFIAASAGVGTIFTASLFQY